MTPNDALKIELTEHQGVIAVMNQTGDTKTIWDRRNETEVAVARKTFKKFKDAGFMAYSVEGKEGKKGIVIDEFNPQLERIIFAPPMRGGC